MYTKVNRSPPFFQKIFVEKSSSILSEIVQFSRCDIWLQFPQHFPDLVDHRLAGPILPVVMVGQYRGVTGGQSELAFVGLDYLDKSLRI